MNWERKDKEKRHKIFIISKKKLQNYEIKDILEKLNVHSASYFVSNFSILTGWIYNNDVFEVIDPINMNDDEFRHKIFEFIIQMVVLLKL
jgi:UTP-glucose-1-phosphate uridylyltransferase